MTSHTHAARNAVTAAETAESALNYGLMILLSHIGPKRRAKAVAKALAEAEEIERTLKVSYLKMTARGPVVSLRGTSAEQVEHREREIAALEMLLRALHRHAER